MDRPPMSPAAETLLDRPRRWDEPFGAEMTDEDVDRLLAIEPFSRTDAKKFSGTLSLRGILRNDTRIMRYRPGDLIVREGDYGNSAFLILSGRVRASLDALAPELL